MASTTIKVSRDLHERLSVAAAELGLTLGAYIELLMRQRERAVRFQAIREARLRTDMGEYGAQTADLDSSVGDGLGEW